MSLPDGFSMNSSVGSAPNSPQLRAKSLHENRSAIESDETAINSSQDEPTSLAFVPTISGFVTGSTSGPVSLQPGMLVHKYATLPTK